MNKKRSLLLMCLILLAAGVFLFLNRGPLSAETGEEGRGNEEPKPDSESREVASPSAELGSAEERVVQSKADGMAKIADLALPLYFEEDLPQEVRGIIETDLEHIFFSRTFDRQYRRTINGVEQEWISFGGRSSFSPDVVHENFGGLREINGERVLVVPEVLSKAYQDALAFREKHKVAFDALDAKLQELREFGGLEPGQDPREVLEVLVPGAESEKVLSMVAGALLENTLRRPSLLDLHQDVYEGQEVLYARVYVLTEDGGYRAISILWDNGMWKPLIGSPGT